MTITAHWNELVTAALLGSDRREPPTPPAGTIADLAADQPLPSPAERLLQQASAITIAMRAGLSPGQPASPLDAAPDDHRPITPPSATPTWSAVVANWPVLEDEWLLHVVATGHRLSPDLTVAVFARHRSDATRHARALLAAGRRGAWLLGVMPGLRCASRSQPQAEQVVELPELAISPELLPLVSAPPHQVAAAIADGFASNQFGPPHRAVLVNLIARMRRSSLPAVADALDHVDPSQTSIGLAFALADLARLRHHMLTELEPT